jgi:hypothetical protein
MPLCFTAASAISVPAPGRSILTILSLLLEYLEDNGYIRAAG